MLNSGIFPILLGSLNQKTHSVVSHVGNKRSHSDFIRMAEYDAQEERLYFVYWHEIEKRWVRGEEVTTEVHVLDEIPQPLLNRHTQEWESTITTFRVKLKIDPNDSPVVYSSRKNRRKTYGRRSK